jgi:hypothetical protein
VITFTTETGSIYEVDDGRKRARRPVGATHDTVRATEEWRDFDRRTPIEIGKSVVFTWTRATSPLPGSPDDCLRTTITSRVVSVSA